MHEPTHPLIPAILYTLAKLQRLHLPLEIRKFCESIYEFTSELNTVYYWNVIITILKIATSSHFDTWILPSICVYFYLCLASKWFLVTWNRCDRISSIANQYRWSHVMINVLTSLSNDCKCICCIKCIFFLSFYSFYSMFSFLFLHGGYSLHKYLFPGPSFSFVC